MILTGSQGDLAKACICASNSLMLIDITCPRWKVSSNQLLIGVVRCKDVKPLGNSEYSNIEQTTTECANIRITYNLYNNSD